MKLILSPWHSPMRNCALEEYMVTERHDDVLLLYRNTPSVILGRNQTVAAEIDGDFCRAHGIEVVRRLSGGGAVYHDLGNINYAFVSNKEASPVLDRDFLRPVVTLLQVLGVEATAGKRKELLAGGRKISGTASHVTRNRQLFHGTLLHRTDLHMLEQALRGDRTARGKGVASVPSPVANIAELLHSDETTEAFLERFGALLLQYYGLSGYSSISPNETERIAQIERIRRMKQQADNTENDRFPCQVFRSDTDRLIADLIFSVNVHITHGTHRCLLKFRL